MKKKSKIAGDALMSRVGDEGVILHLESGMYFGLDPVGTRIWEMLAGGSSVPVIVAALTTEFDVDEAQASRDLEAFLRTLEERGLLSEIRM